MISDEVKKELFLLPLGQGGRVIEDVRTRSQEAKKSEIKSIHYILARSEVR